MVHIEGGKGSCYMKKDMNEVLTGKHPLSCPLDGAKIAIWKSEMG